MGTGSGVAIQWISLLPWHAAGGCRTCRLKLKQRILQLSGKDYTPEGERDGQEPETQDAKMEDDDIFGYAGKEKKDSIDYG